MRLNRLLVEGFRNLRPTDLTTDARFVVFHGPNAQGKTNALEAIHVIATLKPLRGRRLAPLVAWGLDEASVSGFVEHRGVERHYRVDLGPSGRAARLDGKRVTNLQEYFAGVRTVSFTPSDGRIVSGEPAGRRAWLDRAVFTATPAHLDRCRAYRQVLQQRSAVLRADSADAQLLGVLDEQLCALGAEVAEHRERLLATLATHVQELHAAIAGGSGELELRYATRALGDSPEERRRSLQARLAEVRPRELARRANLAGPHLDDVQISLAGQSSREFASRGQVRSVVLALKLAEMVAAGARGEVPVFLIDDASTELDAARTTRLMELLSGLGAQVFATTTDASPLAAALPASDTLMVAVADGTLASSAPESRQDGASDRG